jgi:hypothetical protein
MRARQRAMGWAWAWVVVAVLPLSGCLLNSVSKISHKTGVAAGQSIVVIGLGLDAAWPYTGFALSLDEYSLEKSRTTGNCFHYNHINAEIPPAPASIRYFAYKVPAGVYVYSAFNGNPAPQPAAFIAPSGKAVYFGDYIYVGNRVVQMRSNLGAAQIAVRPLLAGNLVLTQASSEPSVIHGTMFLCTP